MKICIIGAGPTGLGSLKYSLEKGYRCDVYEQTGTIGGTWIYTDRIDTDEFGLPVHSSMYENLTTNLPKETMSFLDFPFPEGPKSYVAQPEVVAYFNKFAQAFDLSKHVQFYKYVKRVAPTAHDTWKVTFLDLKTEIEATKEYDSVFVCSGHYSSPKFPKIAESERFEGHQMHSHQYRKSEPFRNKKILIIGAGPSGLDICNILSNVAQKIFLSHRASTIPTKFRENVIEKGPLSEFTRSGGKFEDGTEESFDSVLYCTGYKYSYPFLSEECGIEIEDNWVRPLYKHIVNIRHPTMFFIGVPFTICVIPMFDIQVRFALAALCQAFRLPSREKMLQELNSRMDHMRKANVPQRYAHRIGFSKDQEAYFADLSQTANIKNIPDVINKLYAEVKFNKHMEDCFKIIDEERFVKFKC